MKLLFFIGDQLTASLPITKFCKMKNIILLLNVIWLLFPFAMANGQNNPNVAKLSMEEQALFEKSIQVNPPKIPEVSLADPKMTNDQNGHAPVNWKPVITPIDDNKAEISSSQSALFQLQSKPSHPNGVNVFPTQPEASQSQSKVMNYRTMQGSKEQPDAQKSQSKVMNYRMMQGSREQPDAQKSSVQRNYRDVTGVKSQPIFPVQSAK